MARPPTHPDINPSTSPVHTPRHIKPELYLQAAMRLLPAPPHERMETGRRFLAGARIAGYDLTNMWGTLDEIAPTQSVREVCLAIEGPGRTAMCFVSGPPDGLIEDEATGEGATHERATCLRKVVEELNPERVCLAQGLPEPHETWTIGAYKAAGFTHAGELAYLELEIPAGRSAGPGEPKGWPEGIEVRSVRDPVESDAQLLIETLDATYIQTLDCPELCGLRPTVDVLASHMATGTFDPSLWLLALEGPTPVGCSLVSLIPENGSAELVYIGLAPSGRGKGLAQAMLHRSIAELRRRRVQRLVCAVDRRNSPAMGLYSRLGFEEFSARSAWVCPIR